MRILVACEESQAVTLAFRRRGHEAYSADLQDCSGGHPEWHIKGDCVPLLSEYWDMVVAFPSCTHLAVSGARHFQKKRMDGRQREGVEFFMVFTSLEHIPKVAIENPIGIMSSIWRRPDQIIQPWQFGHGETKATCLWLKGLNKLVPTNIVPGRDNRIHRGAGYSWNDPMCAKMRSKTFPGIAEAMATQWGDGEYPEFDLENP